MTITDQEFRESVTNSEGVFERELGRAPIEASNLDERTFMDRLGRGRWATDYITARQRGYGHQDAMTIQRIEIRHAAGLPPSEPMPVPPLPPAPPVPPADGPGVQDNMIRFATFYRAQCAHQGWRPNQFTTREERVEFLRRAVLNFRSIFPHEVKFWMKRADANRPISDEVVVWLTPSDDYRRFWDFLANGGSAAWSVKVTAHDLGDGEILPAEQLIVDPLTLDTIPGAG